MWLHTEVIKSVMNFCKEDYPVVDYGYTTIPTYPSGQIGFILCSLSKVRFSEGDALLSLLILVERYVFYYQVLAR